MCLPICIFLGSLFFSMRCIVFSASDLVLGQLSLRDCCLWSSPKTIQDAIFEFAIETILIAWWSCLFLHGSLLCLYQLCFHICSFCFHICSFCFHICSFCFLFGPAWCKPQKSNIFHNCSCVLTFLSTKPPRFNKLYYSTCNYY